jgi:hypothetical protein
VSIHPLYLTSGAKVDFGLRNIVHALDTGNQSALRRDGRRRKTAHNGAQPLFTSCRHVPEGGRSASQPRFFVNQKSASLVDRLSFFVDQSAMKHNRVAITESLLQMAEGGAPRPKQLQGIEGKFLSGLTCEKHAYYDREFDEKIRSIRPDWFPKPKHNPQSLKDQILVAARSGHPRPRGRTGNALSHYLNRKCLSFDSLLDEEVRRLRPDWFRDSRIALAKQNFIKSAKAGEPRPDSGILTSYTQPSSEGYDEVFSATLRELRPDWFFNKTEEIKRELLEHARRGGDRPSLKNTGLRLYRGFRRYTRAQEQYDSDFVEKLKEIRPDWF